MNLCKTQFLQDPNGTIRAFRRSHRTVLMDAEGLKVVKVLDSGTWPSKAEREVYEADRLRLTSAWVLTEITQSTSEPQG